MRREIKFRAWDKLKKEYIYFSLSDMFSDRYGLFVLKCIDNFIIEQFTGLQDSEGVDIYEGDIVVNSVNKKYKVCFKNYSFYFIALTDNQKYNFEKYIRMITKANVTFKVIGNIHENPELLNN